MDAEDPVAPVVANPAVDQECREIVDEIARLFPNFRFVLLAVDPENVFSPILTLDRRICIHEGSELLDHFAHHTGIVASQSSHRQRRDRGTES